jgi:hypothetical protein
MSTEDTIFAKVAADKAAAIIASAKTMGSRDGAQRFQ